MDILLVRAASLGLLLLVPWATAVYTRVWQLAFLAFCFLVAVLGPLLAARESTATPTEATTVTKAVAASSATPKRTKPRTLSG